MLVNAPKKSIPPALKRLNAELKKGSKLIHQD
jgi:hypothetical protein